VVGQIAASNYTPERLTAALELQREVGLAEFTVLQPHYNVVERDFERTLNWPRARRNQQSLSPSAGDRFAA
jgi:aryl-alcohol dehydrogenase-like predicted oxidoreductase